MNRGTAEEAVVIVKLAAEEFRVTWRRIKQRISDRMLEVKGGTSKRFCSWMIDWRTEISLTGAVDYLRRKQ
jgi:hypothetical protein